MYYSLCFPVGSFHKIIKSYLQIPIIDKDPGLLNKFIYSFFVTYNQIRVIMNIISKTTLHVSQIQTNYI